MRRLFEALHRSEVPPGLFVLVLALFGYHPIQNETCGLLREKQ